jgi:tRNA 2-(methylsulfanyl)-N6-isopentenyladenosine37 hydroxylase
MADILAAPTPALWVSTAVERWRELLQDHANCEKKAASTALALMFAYPEDLKLCQSLARLAREELLHFEQVQKLMIALAVPVQRMGPGRYAGALRTQLATGEPRRKLDLLLCGALIEARSCERFELLAPQLSGAMSDLYADLIASERRHEGLYLRLAEAHVAQTPALSGDLLVRRLAELAVTEAALITQPDPRFRFHSGLPVESA